MAYSTDNPPALVSQGVAGFGKTWAYDSADAATVVRVDGYITNAEELGMAVGDRVEQFDSAGGTVSHVYNVVAINANGSADLSDGTAIASTDTD
ncbi:hypothetical protein [Litorivivens sp.]|uniref:hypothetical protein n=1 Tax=Litorivivens sp. TaxID=2020868 RepID=UPI00356A9550